MYVSVWNFCLGVADVRPRKTSPAERSKEKWLFLQAKLCTELALENDFDILSISENWFNSSVTIATVEIPGYRIFKLDRIGKTGANICVSLAYINCGFKCKTRSFALYCNWLALLIYKTLLIGVACLEKDLVPI